MRNIIVIIPVVICLALGGLSVSLYLKNNDLNQQIHNSKRMLNKMDEEVKRVDSEKEKLAKDNEKLQVDAVSYIGLNNDLQKDKEDLQEKAKKAREAVAFKEIELKRLNQKFTAMDKKAGKEKDEKNEELNKEKTELAKRIKALEETLKKERGLYHYNLAVAYTEAKLLDEAIEAYKKSLEFDPGNPDAHYNLGLLYENKGDPVMAVSYYRKYLELKPNANDKEEVEGWIEKLGS